MKVLLTGATGLIGKEIGKMLVQRGHEVLVISRDAKKAEETLPFPSEVIVGDLTQGVISDSRLESVEGVINLLGESVASSLRWTEEKKSRIYSSRVDGTKNLIKSFKKNPRVFVSGSATGFYGDRGEENLDENSLPGADFLAKVCIDWEKALASVECRKVFVRTGIVLSAQGGALERMLLPFRVGLGGALADGSHWMSWIHLNDIVNLFVFALENDKVQGPLNGVAPQPVRNRDFTQVLAHSVGSGVGPAAPRFILKAVLGEMSGIILSSQRVSAKKAMELGFKFQYENIEEALGDICKPFKEGEEVFAAEQYVPEPPQKLFEFFKEAKNLEQMTPELLNFHIENVSTSEIKQGTLIDYRLKVHGIPMKWRTEIDEWQPPHKFVDNQLKGPYSLWHHTHEFKALAKGTLMVDRVRYRLPMGKFGWLLAGAMVRKDVESIFAYRKKFIRGMKF